MYSTQGSTNFQILVTQGRQRLLNLAQLLLLFVIVGVWHAFNQRQTRLLIIQSGQRGAQFNGEALCRPFTNPLGLGQSAQVACGDRTNQFAQSSVLKQRQANLGADPTHTDQPSK